MTLEDPIPTQQQPAGLAESQVLGGRYQIERRIGGGGMGEVFLARHLRTGRPLAVKLLGSAAALEPESVQRFEREARVLGSLGHPGIVGIHDFDQTPEGRPYLVMDFLEGEELAARLDREGALAWSEAARIFEEVSGALHAAHGLGVLHRDLKPGNIFLARSAASPERAVLLDFGLAKDLSDEEKRLTRTGLIMGTPLYMSPEQARGTALDVRSDVYSLSAVLYELLSGRPPFEGSSWTAILSALLLEPPPPFGDTLLAKLPDHVDAALRRALSKDPQFRPTDVLSFATAVLGRPPIWAGALGAAVSPGGEATGARGFVTGPTAWADSGDVAAEAHGTARTMPSGAPVPAVGLPMPAGRPAPGAGPAPGGGPAPAARPAPGYAEGLKTERCRSRRRLVLLGAAGLLGAGILTFLLLAWPFGGGGSKGGARRPSGSGPVASARLDAGEPRLGARAGGIAGATADAGTSSPRDAEGYMRRAAGPARGTEGPRDQGARLGSEGSVTRVSARRAQPRTPVPPRPAADRVPPLPDGKPPAGEGPSGLPAKRPLTEADVLAMLPANEQATVAAMKVSDWAGCIRATRQPPETERILQMRIACASSGGFKDVVVSACQTLIRRFPKHPMAPACAHMIRAYQPARGPGGGAMGTP